MATTIIRQYDGQEPPTTVKPLFRATQVVWYILGLFEVLLAFRFILKLVEANPAAGFTDFIYSLSGILVAPFTAVIKSTQAAGSIFEWTTLLAMLVYWLAAWGIVKLLVMGRPVSNLEAKTHLRNQDTEL